jgi:lactate 2-monooxygenase
MAPVGVQSIFHEDKELGLSEVCAQIGVPYILSTASSSSSEYNDVYCTTLKLRII